MRSPWCEACEYEMWGNARCLLCWEELEIEPQSTDGGDS